MREGGHRTAMCARGASLLHSLALDHLSCGSAFGFFVASGTGRISLPQSSQGLRRESAPTSAEISALEHADEHRYYFSYIGSPELWFGVWPLRCTAD